MQELSNKLRFAEHPDNSSLVKLQLNNCGVWYFIEGTTLNSVDDAGKFILLERYNRSLFKEVV